LISADQTKAFVDLIFKSAGDRKELYRVVLKKAILDNLDNLSLLETGQLIPAQDPVINKVMELLDNSNNGLISEKELKEAVKKVTKDHNLQLDAR